MKGFFVYFVIFVFVYLVNKYWLFIKRKYEVGMMLIFGVLGVN